MKFPALETAERWLDRGEFRSTPFSLLRPFTWVAPNHPIARRELHLMQRVGRQWDGAWGCVWFFVFVGPLFGSLACGVGAFFSSIIDAYDALFWLFGLWQLQLLPTLGMKLFASLAAAVVIARERETQNWPLLRITPFSIPNILNAKLAGLYYWLEDSFRLMLYARGILALATFIVCAALVYQTQPTVAAESQWLLWVGGGLTATLFAMFAFAELIVGLLYHFAVGLCVSAYSRASGAAIAFTFLAHLVLWAFIFMPVERLSTFATTQSIVALYPSQFANVIAFGVSSFFIPVLIQAGLTIGAYALAVRQARIAE